MTCGASRRGVVAACVALALAVTGCPPFRSVDGSGNNPDEPQMGAAQTMLRRALVPDYADGASAMAGADRPSPRSVSNMVHAQTESVPNRLDASAFLWQWGQFVDHDIDLTPEADPDEPADIPVPAGDPWFDPSGSGSAVIGFHRSTYDPSTGSDAGNPRQQMNRLSAWIDGSQVYGSDAERAAALRTLDGTGRLRTSAGDLLPFNEAGLPNAGGDDDPELFLAGDVRANEQVGLTALHILFVREHNWLAGMLRLRFPAWDGERIYQTARAIVGAELQAITYNEYLPALLGRGAMPRYTGYRPDVDAGIANVFSTAIFRLGHSQLNATLLRRNRRGRPIPAGDLPLRNAFFAPEEIRFHGGIEPLLRGLAWQRAQAIDVFVIDDVRNFLFGPPGSGGFDLASLNIQRGRDHGVPDYNSVRVAYGLAPAADYDDMTSDAEVAERLEEAYGPGGIDRVDAWTGALAEDPLDGAHVGELIRAVMVDQFARLRDGDRFWFENTLSGPERRWVARTRLADVIRRNTSIGIELQDDVFRVPFRGDADWDDLPRRRPHGPSHPSPLLPRPVR